MDEKKSVEENDWLSCQEFIISSKEDSKILQSQWNFIEEKYDEIPNLMKNESQICSPKNNFFNGFINTQNTCFISASL